MGLSIKNERVHALAREAARVTGKSQTRAVEEALEQLLRAYNVDPGASRVARKIEVVRGLVSDYAADDEWVADTHGIRTADDLYDETIGLPR